jgi:DegV family protein with EDD domain
MKTTTIIVGESSSIPNELVQKYEMYLITFPIDWPEGEVIIGKNIFEKMRKAKEQGIKTFPKTSQPAMGIYKKAYDEVLSKGQDVICITISSKISGTYNSAIQAKKMLSENDQKKVFVFDTFNADSTEALAAIKATELAEQGKTAEEIYNYLLNSKLHIFAMVESPRWLEAGGRINGTIAGALEAMQKIGMRPVLGIKDGVIKPTTLKMQAKDTANALLKELLGIKKNKLKISISHADNINEAEKLKKLIEENIPQSKIEFINFTSTVIGAHVGPGTIIVCALEE